MGGMSRNRKRTAPRRASRHIDPRRDSVAARIEPDLHQMALTLTPLPTHLTFAARAVEEVLARLGRVERRLARHRQSRHTPPRPADH